MSSSIRVRQRLAVLVTALGLMVAACGSSGSSTSGEGPTGSGDTAADVSGEDAGRSSDDDEGPGADAGDAGVVSGDVLGEGDAGVAVITVGDETRTYALAQCSESPGGILVEARVGTKSLMSGSVVESSTATSGFNLNDPFMHSIDDSISYDAFDSGHARGTLEWDLKDDRGTAPGTFEITCN